MRLLWLQHTCGCYLYYTRGGLSLLRGAEQRLLYPWVPASQGGPSVEGRRLMRRLLLLPLLSSRPQGGGTILLQEQPLVAGLEVHLPERLRRLCEDRKDAVPACLRVGRQLLLWESSMEGKAVRRRWHNELDAAAALLGGRGGSVGCCEGRSSRWGSPGDRAPACAWRATGRTRGGRRRGPRRLFPGARSAPLLRGSEAPA